MAETLIVLYLSHFWTEFAEFLYVEIFFPPGKHTIFHQGHKGFKAKGHKVIKARGQENLKPIFCTFYSYVSPFHPFLRHNIPNITEPMEIANCAKKYSPAW